MLQPGEEIIITINRDGSTNIEAKGIKGSSCVDATKPFEAALGHKTSDKQTGEYFEEITHVGNRNQQGW